MSSARTAGHPEPQVLRRGRRPRAAARPRFELPGAERLAGLLRTRGGDVLLSFVLLLLGLLGLRYNPGGTREPDALAVLLILLQVVPLLWRRRFPLPVFAVVILAGTVYWELSYPAARSDFAGPISFFTVASRLAPAQVIPAAVGVAMCVLAIVVTRGFPPDILLVLVVIYACAWILGDSVRRRGERLAALRSRAAAAEIEQQDRVQQAIGEERTRIARELHDTATHALGVIAIQAQVAARTVRERPEQALGSISSIQELSDEALTDLRRLLGLLRSEGADRTPPPTMRCIDGMVERFREAGLPLRYVVLGQRRPLGTALEATAYRVVQEALTNTLKHAGPASAHVTIRYGDRGVEIDITDTGRGPSPAARVGNGLTGMAERVGFFEGQLGYGAGPRGGFQVTARLPALRVE